MLDNTPSLQSQTTDKKVLNYVMIILCIGAPIFSWFFINVNLERFKETEFNEKYGTFYKRQRIHARASITHYWYTSVFFFRRLSIAMTTVLLSASPLYQCWIFIKSALFSCAFTVSTRPFEDPLLQNISLLNDITTLVASYFLVLMTDLVPDLETRELIGYAKVYYVLGVCALNFLVIFLVIFIKIFKFVSRKFFRSNQRQD